MNSYYYLNDQREAQGPHTAEELQAMLASGQLTPQTLAAPAGSDRWMPLEEALRPQSGEAGPCPSCRQGLSCTQGQLPEQCPVCHYRLRAANPGSLWQAFLMGFRKYATFRGRATRTEFWGFYLFVTLAGFLLQALCNVFAQVAISPEAVKGMEALGNDPQALFSSGLFLALCGIGIIYVLFELFTIIPFMALTVRRMHDTGWSGWWFALHLASFPIIGAGIGMIMAESVAANGNAGDSVSVLSGSLLALGSLLYLATALLIFILCLIDSQRGANKYGASPKYPMG